MVNVFLKRLNLRHNWPLLLAAFIFGLSLYLVMILFRFTPPLDAPKFGETILYWSRVINPSIYRLIENFIFIWPIILLLSFVIFGIQRLSRYSKHQGIGCILLIFANLFGCIVFTMSALRPDGHKLVHVQSLTISNHVYHLTLDNVQGGGGDYFYSKYLLFKCASDGNLCNLSQSIHNDFDFDGNPSSAKLSFDNTANAFYLQISDQKTLIAQ